MNQQILIMGTVGFVGVWLAYHFVWCGSVRAFFRQQLFRLRDLLFLEAAEGRASFDDPAYGMLRTMMQRTLSASQDLNVVQVAIVLLFARFNRCGPDPLNMRFAETVASMTDRGRAEIYQKYYDSMMLLVATHLIRTMPVPLVGTVLVFVLCRLPGAAWRRLLVYIQEDRKAWVATYVENAYRLPDKMRVA
jgi:hypothetical protein